jgi:hypothetical protein
MRSLIIRTAIAAVFISTPFAAAFASGGSHGSHESGGSRASHESRSATSARVDRLNSEHESYEGTPNPDYLFKSRMEKQPLEKSMAAQDSTDPLR